ncbi:MAG: methylmalonyl Co-A mutase-associated GTPase MeaB [Deltaproteobacteria bacterium HGW-Deltaproteobacteria-20]|jgi:LAO/AO transport system kinase|nr:MAG: methylmalonyl Co-A mutase-associated GTPase MeaB [Deltaproteobacteria bacterium HGW-Deltaproteobacteria-20]
MVAPSPPIDLADGVTRRHRAAVGRALSLVEDRRPSSTETVVRLLDALRKQSRGDSRRIGFTGPPGAGKSSLVSALARELRKRGLTVGILAVDPSSPRSGGALLGDRARIDPDPHDDGIFVRSMASGGDLGGLARAAFSAVEVLSAAFDRVLVETVGVGQSETDVELVADTTVMVLQPASGDILQFLKAGILEIPDVFVVNKADLGEVAERTRRDLTASVKHARAAGLAFHEPSILSVSAIDGSGVPGLADAVGQTLDALAGSGDLAVRRREGACAWTEKALARRVGELGIEALGGRVALRERVEKRVREGACGLSIAVDLERDAIRTLRATA